MLNKFRIAVACSSFFMVWDLSSCRKLIEVNAPYTSVNAKNVFTNDETAAAVLTGIYTKISDGNSSGFTGFGDLGNFSMLLSLSSDELNLYNVNESNLYYYYANALTSSLPTTGNGYWSAIFPYIFAANSAIEGLTNNTALSIEVRNQLLGEAKFIRALCYFYIVNLYGDAPLVLSTDPLTNALLERTAGTDVYKQIIIDLTDAMPLLKENYVSADTKVIVSERVRPTRWAASALLARVYLYTGDYVNAEIQSTLVINESSLFELTSLENVFLKNNKEAIWQIQPVGNATQGNTGEGQTFVLPTTGPDNSSYPVFLSNWLMNSFENGDKRKYSWIDSVKSNGTVYYYSYKYKVGAVNPDGVIAEYLVFLRLAEQYLIRAEARAMQNNIGGAQSDLNIIRNRAGLGNTHASSKDELLNAILHERQVEFFTEQGHRWLDLKRTESLDSVMVKVTPIKGGTWSSNWKYFPIPLDELKANPRLTQTPGYTN